MSNEQWKRTEEHQRAVEERKRSNAAGRHDSRPKRQRTRATEKLASIREAS